MKTSLLNKITSTFIAGGIVLSHASFAQEAEQAQQESGDELEVIMVTANRTSSSAEKTPVALSALGPNQLRDQGITNPTQLAETIPNISIDRNNGLQITIRGVSSTDNTEKGDPSAAFMLDGIYIARPQAQEVSFFDISRVEVLRGPQGTLYGRNTTAGLINVIANKPHEFFETSFDINVGNYNARQFTGVVNLPVNDNVKFRAAVNVDQRDTYIDYKPLSSNDGDISDFKDNRSVRLSGLFNFSDDMELLVRVDYSQIKGNGFSFVPVSNFYETPFSTESENPVYVEQGSTQQRTFEVTGNGFPDVSRDNSTWGVMSDFSWSINNEMTFNYLGAYREFEREDDSAFLLGGSSTDNTQYWAPTMFEGDYEQQSHEFRLAYDNGDLQAQAGVYYFDEQSGIFFGLLGLLAPNEGDDGYVFGFPQDPTKSTSLGFFGQATYSLTDELRVTAGIRSTEDEKSRRGATVYHRTLGEALNFEASDDNPIADSLNFAERTYTKTTWKLGVDYDLTEKTFVYGSIATGYKAGGFNDGCVEGAEGCTSPLPEAAVYYDPETLTSYELGVKTRLLKNKMRLSSSVFHYDYEDLQLSQVSYLCGGPCQVTTNAAEATVNGLELDLFYRPIANNNITASFTWLDAKYDDWVLDEETGENFAGEPLSRSPKYTFNVGYDYILPLETGDEVTFGVRSRWSDEYYITNNTLRANFRQPSQMKTDVTVTYNSENRDWYVQGFVKNIEDAITVSNATSSSDYNTGSVSFADPRLFGVRFGYKFE